MKTTQEINFILNQLISMPSENEVVEFKEAKNEFDFRKLGKYFSALSNEANLKGANNGWLVFGVENNHHQIVGTQYRNDRKDLDSLKKEIADKTTGRITFIEIYTINHKNGRVILFEIPAAPKGFPIAYDGHYFARDHESLVPLNLNELENIRGQIQIDWSAKIIEEATFADLDNDAIQVARQNYKVKFSNKAEEVDSWDDITFLNKCKVTRSGKITNTAIVLLGKEEAVHFLNPSEATIRWVLRDSVGNSKDYELFFPPLLLAVNKVYSKIRNIKYRYIKNGDLFPEEVYQYDPYIIREALNNCIAHQDYTKGGRINVIEKEDELIFSNKGAFIPGSIEQVIEQDAPEEKYRNTFLAQAMFHLNMVDTIGSGIRKMFTTQALKFFPLPDYEIDNKKVSVSIIGKVLDINYASVLARDHDLTLKEIIMLDKVQKDRKLSLDEIIYLKKKKLIEGRKPNYIIAKSIAQKIGQKISYTKNKGLDNEYYRELIMKAIKQHKLLTRKEIDELLWDKLPDNMDDETKKIKIGNLISDLRIKDLITNNGTNPKPIWKLKKDS
jgi:ATP-dependent DNA helicase RecG